MRETDYDAFAALLDDVQALLRPGQPLGGTAKAMYFRSLGAHSLDQVRSALDGHVRDPQRGRFMPLPADVIAQIEGTAAADGRPGAEEAWAIALRSSDENETVIWTREIAEALGIARPILKVGDEVGARMAFREAYNRLVDEARRSHMPLSWEASLGYDPQRRDEALRAGVEAGRLPQTALPAPAGPAVPLLTLAESPRVPEHIRAELRRLSDQLRAKHEEPSADAKAKAETEARRAASARQVEQYAQERGIDLKTHHAVVEAPPAAKETLQ
jgi:hypothetical protein